MNLASFMEAVACALLGDPNEQLSKPGELRFGTNGSMSVDLIAGTFFDHELAQGGGVLDLIKRERGLVGKAAFDFMRDLHCDVDDPPIGNGGGGNGANGAAKVTTKKKLAAAFAYPDETGAVLFETVRYHFENADGSLIVNEDGKPVKQISQRRPDPTRPGKHVWNVKTVRIIPYRLKELTDNLRSSPNDPVFVPEGEAKVDALWKWDLMATCNAGGARKWKPEHSEFLRGRNVIILPDNDEPGRAHRDVIGASLQGINHALLLGGAQGIGKDTMLEPVKRAVGPWNCHEVSPQQVLGRFNGFLKSVILRVSEARDLGDVNRYALYEHMKALTASPPDVLRVDEKNLREHSVINCVGVIITTNHKTDSIFLPPDDRRHYVAWSDRTKDDFPAGYWNALWAFYNDGGDRHVAAYLAQLDLSDFDPKAPPPKTAAFWDIVDANSAPEDAELADVLDEMGNPDAVTIAQITAHASGDFEAWIRDRKNRRVIPHRLERCGYVPVRNEGASDGMWPINRKRQAIYAKSTLSVRNRIEAARQI